MISKDKIPGLKGLVLAGGKSKRMGHDKTLIAWHGKEQRYHAADILLQLCSEVLISCRAEQAGEIAAPYKALPDTYENMGPYGGILTALSTDKEAAWLVVASDLPLLDELILYQLVAERDPAQIATTFESPHDGLPEPLITIWEPAAREVLLSYLEEGLTCPRKALLRNIERVKLIRPATAEKLINANTPEDAGKVADIIKQQSAT